MPVATVVVATIVVAVIVVATLVVSTLVVLVLVLVLVAAASAAASADATSAAAGDGGAGHSHGCLRQGTATQARACPGEGDGRPREKIALELRASPDGRCGAEHPVDVTNRRASGHNHLARASSCDGGPNLEYPDVRGRPVGREDARGEGCRRIGEAVHTRPQCLSAKVTLRGQVVG